MTRGDDELTHEASGITDGSEHSGECEGQWDQDCSRGDSYTGENTGAYDANALYRAVEEVRDVVVREPNSSEHVRIPVCKFRSKLS